MKLFYDIPKCLLLRVIFKNHSKPFTQCTSLSSLRIFLPKPAGVIPEAARPADSRAVSFTTWKRFQKAWWIKVLMALYHSVWMGKEASVYSHLSTSTSQMLITLFCSIQTEKHRRHKNLKFAVHLDTWCYSLFVSERGELFCDIYM